MFHTLSKQQATLCFTPLQSNRQHYVSGYFNLYSFGYRLDDLNHSALNDSKHALSSIYFYFVHELNFDLLGSFPNIQIVKLLIVSEPDKNFPYFLRNQKVHSYSQEPATCAYPKPLQSSRSLRILFSEDQF
jgi:hypothetical protein